MVDALSKLRYCYEKLCTYKLIDTWPDKRHLNHKLSVKRRRHVNWCTLSFSQSVRVPSALSTNGRQPLCSLLTFASRLETITIPVLHKVGIVYTLLNCSVILTIHTTVMVVFHCERSCVCLNIVHWMLIKQSRWKTVSRKVWGITCQHTAENSGMVLSMENVLENSINCDCLKLKPTARFIFNIKIIWLKIILKMY